MIKTERPNPIVSFVVTPEEYAELGLISLQSGASMAQICRGIFRWGYECAPRKKTAEILALAKSGRITQ